MNRKYLKITNKDGKVWLMPKQHMKTGLELYQPSSKKGMLLKRWLPWLYWLKPLMGKMGMSDIEYVMDPQIHHIIEKEFNQDDVEYSVFEGTPCVHQKTTIQIFKGENILGYCKVTKNPELYSIFQHEQKLLGWFHEKGVGQIPECPYCGKTEDGNIVFLQTTTKTLNSLVGHERGIKQLEFLSMLKVKTGVEMLYHESDQYQAICSLKAHENLLTVSQQKIMSWAVDAIETYYGAQKQLFCAYHADFTPWNMFEDAGRLFVFDFEYGRYSYMPYLDMFHFLTQTAIFERELSAKQIYEEMLGRETELKEFFDNPWMAYLIYLVDVTARFVVRDGLSRTSDVDKLIKTWFELMELVMNKLK